MVTRIKRTRMCDGAVLKLGLACSERSSGDLKGRILLKIELEMPDSMYANQDTRRNA